MIKRTTKQVVSLASEVKLYTYLASRFREDTDIDRELRCDTLRKARRARDLINKGHRTAVYDVHRGTLTPLH